MYVYINDEIIDSEFFKERLFSYIYDAGIDYFTIIIVETPDLKKYISEIFQNKIVNYKTICNMEEDLVLNIYDSYILRKKNREIIKSDIDLFYKSNHTKFHEFANIIKGFVPEYPTSSILAKIRNFCVNDSYKHLTMISLSSDKTFNIASLTPIEGFNIIGRFFINQTR